MNLSEFESPTHLFKAGRGRQDLAARTHCGNNHEFTPENTRMRKDGGRECVTCRRQRDRAAKARSRERMSPGEGMDHRAKNRLYSARRYARLKGLPIPALEELVKKDNLAYLKLSEEAAQAETDLGFAVEKHGRPKCYENPGPYTDYDEESPPTRIEAAKLCMGCKVFEECAIFAMLNKPTTGVWAGEQWQESDKVGIGEKRFKS